MKTKPLFKFLVLLVMLFFNCNLFSQESTDTLRNKSINIFIDCNYCDNDFIRKQIDYVNYVREIKEAHVYILITYQMTGSGGREFSFLFKGQKEFEGQNDTLSLVTEKNNTDSEMRDIQIHTLKIGLLRYMAQTPLAGYFKIKFDTPEKPQETGSDKWNSWIFNFSVNAFMNGEKLDKSSYFWSNLSASRITEKTKITNRLSGTYESYYYNDGSSEYKSEQYSYGFFHLYAYALNSHWSVGELFKYQTSLYSNYKNSFSFSPAIEYNIYPFSESTRKLLVFNYRFNSKYNQYMDTTIYFKTNELLFQQYFGFSYIIKEKWGSVNTSLTGSNYFNDFKFNRLTLYSRLNLRVLKGVSVNLSCGASLIHDQLNLAKGEITSGDLLLQQQELETNFRIWANFGINIQFGSIFNNTVNERFGGSNSSDGIIIIN